MYIPDASRPALPGSAPPDPARFEPGRAAQPPADAGGGLAGYWSLIKHRKLLFATGALLGAIAAFVVLLLSKPVYQATTTIELQGFNESFMGMAAVDPQAGTGAYAATPANINTQIRIIESASVRAPVLDRLRRELTPSIPPAGGVLAPLRAKLRGPEDPLVEMRNGLMMAAFSLRAKLVLNTRIVAISADSTVPEIASNFVNAVASEYMSQNSQQRAVNSQRTSQWLETQIEETRAKLEQTEAKLQAFVRQSGIAYAGTGRDEESLANTKLRELQGSLGSIQGERIRAQAQYEQIKSSPPDQLPNVVQDPLFREYEQKLSDLRGQLAQLSVTLTPAHYKIQRLEQQITEVTAALEKEKQAVLDRSRTDYESAQRKEQLLTRAYQAQTGAVSSQADKTANYEMLKREVDLYQQTLNMMLQQANQAAVVSAVPTNNVRVLDTAFMPGIPYKPNGLTYEIYGVIGGIAASIALAFLIEAIQRWRRSVTFGTPGFSARLLNVPELGVIPSIAVQRRLEAASKRKWLPLPSRASAEDGQLVMSTARPSLVAESFRLTLTSILLMSRRGMHPKVIVITSPGPGEGKTTVVSNMAIATAESGRRVLVIDADLRKPRIHSMFGVENRDGFAEAMAKMRGNGSKASPSVAESNIPGVFVMSAGTVEGRKLSQIFHAAEIPALLNKLAGQFDVILIDTPPMLQFSDARLMARYADGVILVVRSGKTDRDSAVAAREQLAQDHIEVLGTVLNDWDAKGSEANSLNAYYKAYLEYQKTAEASE